MFNREVFARYGPIYEVSIIRDRVTKGHKGTVFVKCNACYIVASVVSTGCCFLTFCSRDSAVKAAEALHTRHTLPGVSCMGELHMINDN